MKTKDKDGYSSVQVGLTGKISNLQGHLKHLGSRMLKNLELEPKKISRYEVGKIR